MKWYVGKFDAGETQKLNSTYVSSHLLFHLPGKVFHLLGHNSSIFSLWGLPTAHTSHSLVTSASFIFFTVHIRSQQTFSTKGQTTPCRPNPACPMFLYSLWAKNGFYNFKWLEKTKTIFCDTCKLYEIQTLVSVNKVLWAHSYFLHVVYGYCCATGADLSSYNKDYMPAKPNIFTIWPELPTPGIYNIIKIHG